MENENQRPDGSKKAQLVKKIRTGVLIAIICCLIGSWLAGKKLVYVGAGLLAVYLGLTYLMEKLEKGK